MGNITITLDDKRERKLRRFAKEKYNNAKGAMRNVVSEALDKLEFEDQREQARQRLIAGMHNGFYMGKIIIKNRDELYDRFDRK
jgi:hypothetical protein